MALVETDELKPKMRTTLRNLMTDFDRWRMLLATRPHTEVVQTVLDESGYTDMWKADKTPEAPGRLENLKELIVALGEFENLGGFLEHVSLVMDNAEASGSEMVSVMTLHGAKGLEFDYVFLPGWEDGLFPSQRSMDDTGIAGLEEERRLAYVGLTRARLRAHVSHAATAGCMDRGSPRSRRASFPSFPKSTSTRKRRSACRRRRSSKVSAASGGSGFGGGSAASAEAGSNPGRSVRLRDR